MSIGNFAARFDRQGEDYDRRAYLPETVCRSVVQGLMSLAGLHPGDIVVEVGVGSGQVSQWLCREPVTYLGFDRSRTMLDACARKIRRNNALLLQADGDNPWPIASGCARLVFGSRSIHLLEPDHVVSEVLRLASRKGAALIIGRVKRPQDSVPERAKVELRRLLRADGHSALDGEANRTSLFERLTRHGATVFDPMIAGSWSVITTPAQVIAGWEGRPGLAGVDVARPLKDTHIAALRRWAAKAFGGLETPVTISQSYILNGVLLPGTRHSRDAG